MKTYTALTLLVLASPFAAAKDDGLELRLSDCPEPVRKTIEAHSRDGRLDEIEHHAIDGKSLYVAEFDLPDDLDLKLHIRGDGALIKTVEDVAPTAIPRFLEQLANQRGGRLDDVEKETTGRRVVWHAEIERRGQPDLDLIVDASGRLIRETVERDD